MEEIIPQEEPAPWPKKPWFYIWIKPRETIRAIVDSDVKRYVFVIAILFGLIYCSKSLHFQSYGFTKPLNWVFANKLIFGIFVGLFRVYIGGIIVHLIGKKLGGKATIDEVVSAIAWMNIPGIVYGIFLLPRVYLNIDTSIVIHLPLNENPPITNILYILGILFIVYWQYVRVVSISEVHQFSIWKSMVTLYVPFIIFLAIWISFVYFVLLPLTT